ncbi:hypothetical protein HK101_008197 [Irineochytrium annulatum]|nr:hypothetical protein HK101_008197 [Irineochytrium annulatum]
MTASIHKVVKSNTGRIFLAILAALTFWNLGNLSDSWPRSKEDVTAAVVTNETVVEGKKSANVVKPNATLAAASGEESTGVSGGETRNLQVAVMFTGSVRTLVHSKVYHSIKKNLLDALADENDIDVYFDITVEPFCNSNLFAAEYHICDDSAKTTVNMTRFNEIAKYLGAVDINIMENFNCDHPYLMHHPCCDEEVKMGRQIKFGPFFSNTQQAFNGFYSYQRKVHCYETASSRKKYDYYVSVRPDTLWWEAVPSIKSLAKGLRKLVQVSLERFVAVGDFAYIVPAEIASQFFQAVRDSQYPQCYRNEIHWPPERILEDRLRDFPKQVLPLAFSITRDTGWIDCRRIENEVWNMNAAYRLNGKAVSIHEYCKYMGDSHYINPNKTDDMPVTLEEINRIQIDIDAPRLETKFGGKKGNDTTGDGGKAGTGGGLSPKKAPTAAICVVGDARRFEKRKVYESFREKVLDIVVDDASQRDLYFQVFNVTGADARKKFEKAVRPMDPAGITYLDEFTCEHPYLLDHACCDPWVWAKYVWKEVIVVGGNGTNGTFTNATTTNDTLASGTWTNGTLTNSTLTNGGSLNDTSTNSTATNGTATNSTQPETKLTKVYSKELDGFLHYQNMAACYEQASSRKHYDYYVMVRADAIWLDVFPALTDLDRRPKRLYHGNIENDVGLSYIAFIAPSELAPYVFHSMKHSATDHCANESIIDWPSDISFVLNATAIPRQALPFPGCPLLEGDVLRCQQFKNDLWHHNQIIRINNMAIRMDEYCDQLNQNGTFKGERLDEAPLTIAEANRRQVNIGQRMLRPGGLVKYS